MVENSLGCKYIQAKLSNITHDGNVIKLGQKHEFSPKLTSRGGCFLLSTYSGHLTKKEDFDRLVYNNRGRANVQKIFLALTDFAQNPTISRDERFDS